MRELHVASKITTLTQNNTADFAFDAAAKSPTHVALRRRVGGEWRDITSQRFRDEVSAVAKGVVAAGIAPGDRVAVMSKTRYEWTVVDFALFTVGAVVVPIYETSSAEQVQWILGNSAARAIFVETDGHAAIVAEVRADLPDLEQVWQFEHDVLDSLAKAGLDIPDEDIDKRRRAVTLDDLASIIYTSGTTGRPKGCELSHRAFVVEAVELQLLLADFFSRETSTLLFLPIAHVFGRVIEIGAIATGCTLGHTADVKNLIEDLAGFQPTFVLAVPRVFEKVYNSAKQKAHADRQGLDLRPCRIGRDRLFGGRREAPDAATDQGAAPAVRQARLRQVACRARRPLRGRGVGRRAVRCATRALLPRHRRDDLRGLRPDRDVCRRHGQPPGRHQDRHRRSAGGRHDGAGGRRRRAAVQGAAHL